MNLLRLRPIYTYVNGAIKLQRATVIPVATRCAYPAIYHSAELVKLNESKLDITIGRKTGQRRGMKIYTKTGDKGTSQLYSGERRAKDDEVFMALGDVDELNANLGVSREYAGTEIGELANRLELIQSRLFDVGSAIATPTDKASEIKINRVKFSEAHVTDLEGWIDEMEATLPPLRNFILPSGGLASAHLHICRAVCRRAERRVVGLFRDGSVDEAVAKYLNRLSDFLFVAARYTAQAHGKTEKIWRKSTKEEGGSQ